MILITVYREDDCDDNDRGCDSDDVHAQVEVFLNSARGKIHDNMTCGVMVSTSAFLACHQC